jgi:hypothetical protein
MMSPGEPVRWFRGEQIIEGRSGRFQMTGDQHHRYFAARVEADGYRAAISPTYKANQGAVEWEAKRRLFRLFKRRVRRVLGRLDSLG